MFLLQRQVSLFFFFWQNVLYMYFLDCCVLNKQESRKEKKTPRSLKVCTTRFIKLIMPAFNSKVCFK